MQPVRAALVGCGYWGPNLLRNLVESSAYELRYVIEKDEGRLEYVRGRYPAIEGKTSLDEVLHDEKLEALVIATPPRTHFEITKKAILAGKHVLVEKPLCLTSEEANGLSELSAVSKVVVMTGHTFLFNAAFRHLLGIVRRGGLGDLRFIISRRLNLGRARPDVDVLWNLGPHDLSMIQLLLDHEEPGQVQATAGSYLSTRADVASICLSYEKGVKAWVELSWLWPEKTRRMVVVGSEKMAIYDDIAPRKLAILDVGIDAALAEKQAMDFDSVGEFLFRNRLGDVVYPKIDWQEPLNSEIGHFVECIRTGAECIAGTEHAGQVVRILERCSKSMSDTESPR